MAGHLRLVVRNGVVLEPSARPAVDVLVFDGTLLTWPGVGPDDQPLDPASMSTDGVLLAAVMNDDAAASPVVGAGPWSYASRQEAARSPAAQSTASGGGVGSGWSSTILASALMMLPVGVASEENSADSAVLVASTDAATNDTTSAQASRGGAAAAGQTAADISAAVLLAAMAVDAAATESETTTSSSTLPPSPVASGQVAGASSFDVGPVVSTYAATPASRGSSTDPRELRLTATEIATAAVAGATEAATSVVASLSSHDGASEATTFLVDGEAFQILIGDTAGSVVDFSAILPPPAEEVRAASTTPSSEVATDAAEPASVAAARVVDSGAPNGVYVDLATEDVTVATPTGDVTVQAWRLDADGKIGAALAHIENIDNVVGTIGNDIIVGDADANTFTYTAVVEETGTSGIYGFDIYVGGAVTDAPEDDGDTVDFSRLDLDDAASSVLVGIAVDLAEATVIATIDPMTGGAVEMTGALVTAIESDGGDRPLALLAFSASAAGATAPASSIEAIVGSGGADVLRGNDADNTFVVVGDGSRGASDIDGRGGDDTVDFSQIDVAADGRGIHVDLGADGGGVAIAADGTTLAILTAIETLVGSAGDDELCGDDTDNTLYGGEGSDTFVFVDFENDDWRGESDGKRRGGDDVVADFDADWDSGDVIAFSTSLLEGLERHEARELLEDFLDAFGQDEEDGFRFVFGEDQSVLLLQVFRNDIDERHSQSGGLVVADGHFFYI